MAEKLRLWFDAEADFLEIRFSDEPGTMKATANDSVMERLNRRGAVIGFTIQNVSSFKKGNLLEAILSSV